MSLNGKKLLVLAGKPIGSCEIVEYAKSQGVYTIVTDFLSVEQSAAKRLADEYWDVSTADIETLKRRIIEEKIDGIYTGVHEFNIRKMIELCSELGLPCFCSLSQWDTLNNKRYFKDLCKQYDVPVTKEYFLNNLTEEEFREIDFPVIVKPVDGSGSRGFSICREVEELKKAYEQAILYSETKGVLVEKYMKYENSVIINYTLVNGEIYFGGISDKHSRKVFEDGAPVMAVQFYPSTYEKKYIEELNEKVKKMFKGFGLKNGVIWIEAFCDEGEFTFNEMGFRFGGSLTYLPVDFFFGINQLELQIEYVLTGTYKDVEGFSEDKINDKVYCILPVHVDTGTITQISGLKEIEEKEYINRVVPVHFIGDKIERWGSAQQVFAYIHLVGKDRAEIDKHIDEVLGILSIKDELGKDMLFNLYR